MNITKISIPSSLPDLTLKKIKYTLIVLIAFVSISTLIIGYKNSRSKQEQIEMARLASLKTSDAPTSRILLINLGINGNPTQRTFSIKDISAYNGHLDTPNQAANEYKLKLLSKDGTQLYDSYFTTPTFHSEAIDPTTGDFISLGRTTSEGIALKVPYHPNGTTISIEDTTGKVLFSEVISNINEVNNQSRYNTVSGEDVVR